MDDLSAVTDVKINGPWIITAEKVREQIVWAQRTGHANCYFQRHFVQPDPHGPEHTVTCVYDLYDERWPTKSVTNDAEYVVQLAYSRQGHYPIIYRDTEGNWDELRHREGHFACFRALDTRDQDEAVRRVLALHEQDKAQHGTN
jgi:hypothetical protein